jgi:hypothetical protein
MRKIFPLFCAIVTIGFLTQDVYAMGSDHSKADIAAKGPTCVHGYWINSSDIFFHAGKADDFNSFLADLAKREGVKLQIVVHQGTSKARSPWDKADREFAVDWKVMTGPMLTKGKKDEEIVRIDLWVGGHIKFADVKYPQGTEVSHADPL